MMLKKKVPRTAPASQHPAPPTTVLLVEDHTVVRQGLHALLEKQADIAVVGEAQDGQQAVELAIALRPDVVVMDLAMPRLNGLEATRQIVAASPTTRVLVLSAHSDHEYVQRASEMGAAGYLLKQSSLNDLAEAIRKSRAGKMYVSPSIAQRTRGPHAKPTGRGAPPATMPHLTVREAQVLQRIAEGAANKETARELKISVKTVEKHRQSLMNKLDIHDVAGLTHYAIAHGVVDCAGGKAEL